MTPKYKAISTPVTSHTISYNANGGSASIGTTKVNDGARFSITSTIPTRTGYKFNGWNAYRNADGTYHVSGVGWLTQSVISSKGYTKGIYSPVAGHCMDSSWTNGCPNSNYTFYACWTTETYGVTYNSGTPTGAAVSGMPGGQTKVYGATLTLSSAKPACTGGYTFGGWKGSGGKTYAAGDAYLGNAALSLTAIWKAPTSNFYVTALEYNAKYKNNKAYDAMPAYRYATRSKEYTTSGYDAVESNNGNAWTKYDSSTTSSISGWSFNQPTNSTSYDNGKKTLTELNSTQYYHYAYAATSPNGKQIGFYTDTSRSELIKYMKRNYSQSGMWSESNLRYMWTIKPSKGTSKISKYYYYKEKGSINCVENSNVAIGYMGSDRIVQGSSAYSNGVMMYYYKPVYNARVTVTTNYFWRWGNWSSWSDWTTEAKATGDTVKKDNTMMYYITKK